LAATGGYQWHPISKPFLTYITTVAGTHSIKLTPALSGYDFDLDLFKLENGVWTRVAFSSTPTSNEFLTYEGGAGKYSARVRSFFGSGSYVINIVAPV